MGNSKDEKHNQALQVRYTWIYHYPCMDKLYSLDKPRLGKVTSKFHVWVGANQRWLNIKYVQLASMSQGTIYLYMLLSYKHSTSNHPLRSLGRRVMISWRWSHDMSRLILQLMGDKKHILFRISTHEHCGRLLSTTTWHDATPPSFSTHEHCGRLLNVTHTTTWHDATSPSVSTHEHCGRLLSTTTWHDATPPMILIQQTFPLCKYNI